MADDIMEIASENDRHMDGDIDFDFELTAPAEEIEDAMIEDLVPTEFYQDGSLNPAPDDLMLDDGEGDSLSILDADLLHDETEHIMEHEPMSFASAETTLYYDNPTSLPSYEENSHTFVTDSIGQDGDRYHEATAVETKDLPEERQDHVIDLNTLDDGTRNDMAKQYPDHADTSVLSRTHIEDGLEEHAAPAHEVGRDAKLESQPDTVAGNDLNQSAAENKNSPHKDEGLEPWPEDIEVPTNSEIIVLYQSNEYSLFSASELDDPDSYFLSDRSVIDQPLSVFISAIRRIIHEDLSDEDELCVAFKDLGLVIEETLCVNVDMTLARIMSLYAQLQLNDGIEESPLHIQLYSRKNFLRRLESMMSGANDGRGLSEFVSWSEVSADIGGSDDVEPRQLEYETNEAGERSNDNPRHDEKNHSEVEVFAKERAELKPDDTEHYEVIDQRAESEVAEDNLKRIVDSTEDVPKPKSGVVPDSSDYVLLDTVPANEVDNDRDSIDYSEDELEGTEDSLVDEDETKVTSNDKHTTPDVVVDVAHSTKAEPQLQLTSQATSDEHFIAPNDKSSKGTRENYAEHEMDEGGLDAEDFREAFEEATLNKSDSEHTFTSNHEQDQVPENKTPLHKSDDFHLVIDVAADPLSGKAREIVDATTARIADVSEEDVEVVEDDGMWQVAQDEGGVVEGEAIKTLSGHSSVKSHEIYDAANSSATLSPDKSNFKDGQDEQFQTTFSAGEISSSSHILKSTDVQEDEIDYEDEEEELEQEPIRKAEAHPDQESPSIGEKRSRADTDLDNAQENQDAKRARS